MACAMCRKKSRDFMTKFTVIIRKKSKRHPEWYQYRRPTEPHELAKVFFDDLYGKRFGKDWRSIRCAMLSRKKYAAILNGFTNTDETEEKFIDGEAIDIVKQLRDKADEKLHSALRDIEVLSKEVRRLQRLNSGIHNEFSEELQSELPSAGSTQSEACETHNLNLEKENYLSKELESLDFTRRLYTNLSQTCPGLHVYAYPKGNLTEFHDPLAKRFPTSILEYFLLDGSSILPVLALDPKPHEHVLDLCAAPGGKFMCIMQMFKSGEGGIVANDVKSTRISRLKKIRDEYVPKDSTAYRNIKVISMDATKWEDCETAVYDKVLADVPCTTDRYSVLPSFRQRDNIFSQLRKRERAALPMLQMNILRNAILACRPGGVVVYSTCTASMQQNEYVVQMTIQQVLQNNGIICEIEDLTAMTDLISDHFHFYKRIELGAMVLPFLDANFGPTFICKISRVN